MESTSPTPSTGNVNATDPRSTIDGEASLVNPPLLRKLDHLSVNTAMDAEASGSSHLPPAVSTPSRLDVSESRGSPQAARSSGIQTPGRGSPAHASSSSPSTSQTSAGSANPALSAAQMHTRPFDLTPVMRNTTREYIDDPKPRTTKGSNTSSVDTPSSFCSDANAIVSPEEEHVLHGEHLALPSDLNSTGPPIPALRQHRSVNTMLEGERDQPHPHLHNTANNIWRPVAFPPTGKFYTFTSLDQYEEQSSVGTAPDFPIKPMVSSAIPLDITLTPYQPSRDDDLEGVGCIPPEATEGIFARRSDAGSATIPVPQFSTSSETHENHRLVVLQKSVPLTERQGSIPSIHLAHRLATGSTTSYTDYTEDEDSLLHNIRSGDADDNASLSSRGSSLCLPDDSMDAVMIRPSSSPPPLSIRGSSNVLEDLTTTAQQSNTSDRRKRKQQRREERQQQALDWLHSVEADQNVLAEAASSKFLTRTVVIPQQRRQTMPAAMGERDPAPMI